ncbi:MAG: PAS domain S-box protein [Bacteroidetes bacterium]|nr:PAS domain S-box protein [Bacteroidota bacterium]
MDTEEINLLEFLEDNNLVMLVVDSETMTIVKANDSAIKFYGYSPDNLIGMNINDINSSDAEKFSEIQNLVRESKQNIHFLSHKLADGSIRDVQAYMQCISHRGRPSVFAIIKDITSYKFLQNELRAKEAIESVLIKNLPIVFYSTPVNFEKDIIWISDSVENVTGYTAREYMSHPHFWRDRIHPDDRQKVLDSFTSSEDARNIRLEYRWKVKNGAYKWLFNATNFDKDDKNGVFSGFFIDITSQKFNLEKRYESEERFRKFFRFSESGKVLCDLNGNFIETNPAFCEFTGYPENELKDMNFKDITHPDDLEESVSLTESLKNGGIEYAIQEKRYIRKDKNIVYANINLSTLKDIQGQPKFLIAQIQDVTGRKNLEALLAESGNIYRTVIDSTGEAVIIQERTGRLIMWNKGAEKIFGLTTDEAVGLNALKVNWDTVKDDGSFLPLNEHPSMVTFRTGKPCHGVVVGVRNKFNGVFRWTSIDTTPLCKSDESLPYAVIIIVSDITERKKFIDEIKNSEERYRTLIDNAAEAIFVVQNDKIVFANGTCSQFSGYPLDDIIGSSIYEFMLDSSDKELKSEIAGLLTGTIDKVNRLHKVRVKNKAVKYCRINSVKINYGGAHALLNFLSDVTEKLRTEEIFNSRLRLLEVSEKLTAEEFLEVTLNEAERLTDSSIGFFHFVNDDDDTLSLKQWSTNTKNKMCKTVPSESHYPVKSAGVWADCVRINGPVIHNDFPNLPGKKGYPEGHACVLRELTVPVNRGGKPVAIIGVGNKELDYTDNDVNSVTQIADLAWDIVQKKLLDENLKISERKLRKSNDEKDKLFSIIAHDLRSPFLAFLGMTNLIAENIGEMNTTEINEYLKRMNIAAENLFSLLNNLLEWSAGQRGLGEFRPEVYNISSVIEETLGAFNENFVKKDIKLSQDINENATVFADKPMIQTVFRNLISNAIKFNKRGGGLRIIAKINSEKRTEVRFEDDGIGMDEEMINSLFDISTNNKRKGTEGEPSTGLGLQICREFVEKNGGTIKVESETEKGTRISIMLPSENHISKPKL